MKKIEKLADIIYLNSGVYRSTAVAMAKKIMQAGYLPVEPVQLEVLPPEALNDALTEAYKTHAKSKHTFISQATITHNEAKGQLYREVKK